MIVRSLAYCSVDLFSIFRTCQHYIVTSVAVGHFRPFVLINRALYKWAILEITHLQEATEMYVFHFVPV